MPLLKEEEDNDEYLQKYRKEVERIERGLANAVGPPTKYLKARGLSGWLARRTGRRIRLFSRRKTKQQGSAEMISPEMERAAAFNVSTAAGKGVSPLLTKRAAAIVALLTSLAGGYLGHEVLVDEQSIEAVIGTVVGIYTAVMSIIAGATWLYKVARNIYTEWGRITTYGVKISGPNADLAFDIAPGPDETRP